MFKRNRRKATTIKKKNKTTNSAATSYQSEARKRDREFKRRQFKIKLTELFDKYKLVIYIGVFSVVSVAVLTLMVFLLHNSRVFVIEEFEYFANERVTATQLDEILNPYKGRSMIAVSNKELEQTVLAKYKFLKSVDVKKILPGKLEIYIYERDPVVVSIGLSGVYLVDRDGVIVTVLASYEGHALTDAQALIVAGYGDINANIVKEHYLVTIEDEEARAEVKWEEVKEEIKKTTMSDLQQVLKARINEQLQTGLKTYGDSEFKDLLVVFTYDNTIYEQGDLMGLEFVDYTTDIIKYFANSEKLDLTKIVWESPYSIDISTAGGRNFLFSSNTAVEHQLRKIDALIANSLLNEGRIFDLRGDKIIITP